MHHEPCRLLSDAKGSGYLVGPNPILAAHKQPHGRQPLFQRNRRVLKHGADLERELLLGMVAVTAVDPRLSKVSYFLGVALRTADLAIGPTNSDHELAAVLEVAEELDGFL